MVVEASDDVSGGVVVRGAEALVDVVELCAVAVVELRAVAVVDAEPHPATTITNPSVQMALPTVRHADLPDIAGRSLVPLQRVGKSAFPTAPTRSYVWVSRARAWATRENEEVRDGSWGMYVRKR